MDTPVNILAIVGSYRKGGIIERAVDEILASAKERGAVTRKITLLDKRLVCMKFEFENPTHLVFGAGALSQIGEIGCSTLTIGNRRCAF